MTEKSLSEKEQASREADRADCSLFVQELLLALMSESTDAIRTGISDNEEYWSSAEDLLLLDSEGLLLKSTDSPAASSRLGSLSSLAGVCDDVDCTSPREVENCEPVSKESFGVVGVSNCSAAGGGIEVARSKAGVS